MLVQTEAVGSACVKKTNSLVAHVKGAVRVDSSFLWFRPNVKLICLRIQLGASPRSGRLSTVEPAPAHASELMI